MTQSQRPQGRRWFEMKWSYEYGEVLACPLGYSWNVDLGAEEQCKQGGPSGDPWLWKYSLLKCGKHKNTRPN